MQKIFTMAFAPLNALSAFLLVAKRLSYAAAARELGVSTSALKQSVGQLEERLGVNGTNASGVGCAINVFSTTPLRLSCLSTHRCAPC